MSWLGQQQRAALKPSLPRKLHFLAHDLINILEHNFPQSFLYFNEVIIGI